jgi:hypothetical protein
MAPDHGWAGGDLSLEVVARLATSEESGDSLMPPLVSLAYFFVVGLGGRMPVLELPLSHVRGLFHLFKPGAVKVT